MTRDLDHSLEGLRPYVCGICSAHFPTPEELGTHIQGHLDQGPAPMARAQRHGENGVEGDEAIVFAPQYPFSDPLAALADQSDLQCPRCYFVAKSHPGLLSHLRGHWTRERKARTG